jgi:hypothetical protein
MMKADVMALFSCVKQTKSPCSQKPTEKITTSNPQLFAICHIRTKEQLWYWPQKISPTLPSATGDNPEFILYLI